jgi:hypothetical protein
VLIAVILSRRNWAHSMPSEVMCQVAAARMGVAAGESLTNGQKAVQGGGTVKVGFSGAPAIRIGFSKYIIT